MSQIKATQARFTAYSDAQPTNISAWEGGSQFGKLERMEFDMPKHM